MAKLSLVVPCYNESANLSIFTKTTFGVLEDIAKAYPNSEFELIFVNDGSSDCTLQMLHSLKNMQSTPSSFNLSPPQLKAK